MTNTDRVFDFLRSISPADASNAEISARTGVRPHQQVFMITRKLLDDGQIDGVQIGHEWRFSWRNQTGPKPTRSVYRAPASGANIRELRPPPWDSPSSSEGKLGFEWKPVGSLSLVSNRLSFPQVGEVPGLYRFRIRTTTSEARYVGETVNLDRRFALYKNPGPSQQTNVRMNGIFRTALAEGAEISVSVAEGAWVEQGGTRFAADLGSKAVRRLFENWAIVEGDGEPIESLNR